MAGRIPRVFISDLLARTDIVDLIDARVKLKKQGNMENMENCLSQQKELEKAAVLLYNRTMKKQ